VSSSSLLAGDLSPRSRFRHPRCFPDAQSAAENPLRIVRWNAFVIGHGGTAPVLGMRQDPPRPARCRDRVGLLRRRTRESLPLQERRLHP